LVVWNRLVPPSTSGITWLQSLPREDSAVSASEALFGTTLVLPGGLDGPELPSSQHHRRIQSVLKNNSTVLPHHSAVPTLKPDQIPSSLSSCSHVFIREPPLSPLDRGLRWVPSLTLCLWIGLNRFL